MAGLPDVGGPLYGIELKMEAVQVKSHDLSADSVLHSQMFRNLQEGQPNYMGPLNASVRRYMAPLAIRPTVVKGDAAMIGDLAVTVRYRRKVPKNPI